MKRLNRFVNNECKPRIGRNRSKTTFYFITIKKGLPQNRKEVASSTQAKS
ncbi:hypothetical protein PMEGAPR185_13690 [Priestia megaterium]